VGDAHRRLGLVDVLAAGAGSAVGVDAAIALVDVDLDAVVDHRIDPHRGEAGVAARVRIERRDAHQPVHARLGLQPAVRVVALDHDRRRLDAGFVAGGLFEHLDVEFAPLAPAHVHAQQHARPVAALGAAGARMHLDIGIQAVGLARQQRLEFAALAFRLQRPELRQTFVLGLGVALLLAEFDQRRRVVELALDLGDRPQPILQHRALAHHLLRGVRMVPEIWVFGFGVQFGEAARRGFDVKDASSAVPRTA
jgi:hypothetical protein